MRVLTLVLLAGASTIWAGEIVRLRNGGSFEIDRHEQQGSDVFLYTKQDVRILEASEILRIETPGQPQAAAAAKQGATDGARANLAARPGDPTIHKMIDDTAGRFGVPASLVHAVAEVESRYQPGVRSGSGAIGVMQLMPGTARHFGVDPYDPAQNIEAGTRFLRELLKKYEGMPNQTALALAAYNAGPSAVEYFGGVPPYEETVRYVEKTMRLYRANEGQ